MAKLSAYKQHELARFEREVEQPYSDLITRERRTFAVLSNGRVLERRIVTFRNDGRVHDYGWKVFAPAGSCPATKLPMWAAKMCRPPFEFRPVPHRGRYGQEPAYVVDERL